jgi:hypothetical protein
MSELNTNENNMISIPLSEYEKLQKYKQENNELQKQIMELTTNKNVIYYNKYSINQSSNNQSSNNQDYKKIIFCSQ